MLLKQDEPMIEFTMLQLVILFSVTAIAAPCLAAMAFLLLLEERFT